MLGVDDVNFVTPDDKFWKEDGVIYLLLHAPRKNGICAKVPVYEAVNNPKGLLASETLQVTSVPTAEKFYADHVLIGQMGMFHFTVD